MSSIKVEPTVWERIKLTASSLTQVMTSRMTKAAKLARKERRRILP